MLTLNEITFASRLVEDVAAHETGSIDDHRQTYPLRGARSRSCSQLRSQRRGKLAHYYRSGRRADEWSESAKEGASIWSIGGRIWNPWEGIADEIGTAGQL